MRRTVGRRLGTRGVRSVAYAVGLVLVGAIVFNVAAVSKTTNKNRATKGERDARALFREGRDIFRNETFGDEAFWGQTIRLHRAIAGARNGGVGPGVSPETALKVGLKVDAGRIPRAVARA